MIITMIADMSVRFTIGDLLKEHDISPYRLSKEADINFNTMYNMVNNKSTRVDLYTLNSVLLSLSRLTGKTFEVSDVLAFRNEERGSDN